MICDGVACTLYVYACVLEKTECVFLAKITEISQNGNIKGAHVWTWARMDATNYCLLFFLLPSLASPHLTFPPCISHFDAQSQLSA